MKTRLDGAAMQAALCFPLLSTISALNIGYKKEEAWRYPVSEVDDYNEDEHSCWIHEAKKQTIQAIEQRKNCRSVYGEVPMVEGRRAAVVSEMEDLTGCYIFRDLQALVQVDLRGIKQMKANFDLCKYKYTLMIYGNDNLEEVIVKGIDINPEEKNCRPRLTSTLLRLTYRREKWKAFEEVFIKANKRLQEENVTADIIVDVGTNKDCTMRMALEGEVCEHLVGDVEVDGDPSMNSVWSRIKKVYGTITVRNLEEENLRILKSVKAIDGWASPALTIIDNPNLMDISAILRIQVTGPEPLYYIQNNSQFCHTVDVARKIEEKVGMELQWTKLCLKSCKGGRVTSRYLKHLDVFCNEIHGDLVIRGLKTLPRRIAKLAQIEKVVGRIIVRENTAIEDLSFLENLEEIENTDNKKPTLHVAENRNLKLEGLRTLKRIHGNALISTDEEADMSEDTRALIIKATEGVARILVKRNSSLTHNDSIDLRVRNETQNFTDRPQGSENHNMAEMQKAKLIEKMKRLQRSNSVNEKTGRKRKVNGALSLVGVILLGLLILGLLVILTVHTAKRIYIRYQKNHQESAMVESPGVVEQQQQNETVLSPVATAICEEENQ